MIALMEDNGSAESIPVLRVARAAPAPLAKLGLENCKIEMHPEVHLNFAILQNWDESL
jgi:hypothetical protein